jgi:hypothetical protein
VPTNCYVATITYPVEAVEHLHVFYHAAYSSEKYLPLRPESGDFIALPGTTHNVIIDCTDDINAALAATPGTTQGLPFTLRVHGRGDHSGPFGTLDSAAGFTTTPTPQ